MFSIPFKLNRASIVSFVYSMAVILEHLGLHGYSILLFKFWAPFHCFQPGLPVCRYWVTNISCLRCPQFLFFAIVLKVVKLQAISRCSEQNVLVDKMFQLFSVLLSRLIDRLFTYSLNIKTTETCNEGIKSSYDEEFRIFK